MAASPQSSAGEAPRCQVLGCDEALPEDAAYYKRNKICRYHFSLPSLTLDGRRVRWCQQCTKFQDIAEYDGNKRSCREALLRHNSRRRKRVGGGAEVQHRRVRQAASARPDAALEDEDAPKPRVRRHREPSLEGPAHVSVGEEEEQHGARMAGPPHCTPSARALRAAQPASLWADSRSAGAPSQSRPAAGAAPTAAAAAASLLQEPQLSQAIATPADSLWGGLGLDLIDMQLPEFSTPWGACTAASWEGSDLPRHSCLSLQSRQSVQLQPLAVPGQPAEPALPSQGLVAGPARACSPPDPAPGPFSEAQPSGRAPQLHTPPAAADACRRSRRQQQQEQLLQQQQQQPAICHSLFMEQAAVPVPTPLPVSDAGGELWGQGRCGPPACSSRQQQQRQQQQRASPDCWSTPQQQHETRLDSRRELAGLLHRSRLLADPPARTRATAHSALLAGQHNPTALAAANLWPPFLPSGGPGECDSGTLRRAGAGAAALPALSRGGPARALPPAGQGAALGSPRSYLLPSPGSQLPSLPLSLQLGGLAAEGSRLLGSIESLEDLPPHLLTKMQSIGVALLDLVQHATSALGTEVTSAPRPPIEQPLQPPPQLPPPPPAAATCRLQAAAGAFTLPWLSGGGGLLELVGQPSGRAGSSSGRLAGYASSWGYPPAQPPLPAGAAAAGGGQLAGLLPHVFGPSPQQQADALAPSLGLQAYQLTGRDHGW